MKIREEIKWLIVSALELEDITPQEINDEEPLFGPDSRLGLDSIDALELGLALKKQFNVGFSEDGDENKKNFRSVQALANYTEENLGAEYDKKRFL